MDNQKQREQAYMTSTILLWIFLLITLAIAIAGLILASLSSKAQVSATTIDGTTAFRVGNHLYIVNGENVARQDLNRPQEPAGHQQLVNAAVMSQQPPQLPPQPMAVNQTTIQQPSQKLVDKNKTSKTSIEPSVRMVQLDDI